MTLTALAGRDLAHLSDKQRALLARRLKGAEPASNDSEPQIYAPAALISQPDQRFEPYALRSFQSDRSSYLSPSRPCFRLFMETRRQELDLGRFRAAWRRLFEHYDVMRSRVIDGRHVVLPPDAPYDVHIEDLRGLPPHEQVSRVNAQRRRFQALGAGGNVHAVEVAVCQVDPGDLRCFFSFDLLVMDLPSTEFLALRCRRIYDGLFDQEHRPKISIRDYRVTEDAYLASVDGKGARRYWERKIARTPARLRARDLAGAAGHVAGGTGTEAAEQGFGYRCETLPRLEWARFQSEAKTRGLNPFAAVQTLFMDLLARQCGKDAFAMESRFFQRLPFHAQIYELLGPFTVGHVAFRESGGDWSFAERCAATAAQSERDAAYGFFDAATLWQAPEASADRGEKIVFTNTCIRFEEFVQNSLVPPLRWFGEFELIHQSLPDTALEYVLVENDLALENHWFVNHGSLPAALVDDLYRSYLSALHALAGGPAAWDATCVFTASQA